MDLVLADQPLEQALIEHVAHQHILALVGRLRVEPLEVEREDLVARLFGEPVDEAVADLTARAGHEDDLLARHGHCLPRPVLGHHLHRVQRLVDPRRGHLHP